MKPSLPSWICSFLTLQSVSSSSTRLKLKDLPNELQHAILISEHVDFCDYVRSVTKGLITFASPAVENAMLAKAAEEEGNLKLEDATQRFRKQQILRSVRALVRIRSKLPIDWKEMSAEELGRWAKVFESSYEACSFYYVTLTWKKACMAGLFGRNTLVTLLPHLSKKFLSNNKILLLQTAFFIGDIESLKAVVEFFGMSNDFVLYRVSALDIVFSGSVPFLEELLEIIPNLMEKDLGLIRGACSLNRLDILLRILEVAEPAGWYDLDTILDWFCRLKLFKDEMIKTHSSKDGNEFLQVAAHHGFLPIIRFLWSAMTVAWKFRGKMTWKEHPIRGMMIGACWNNHRSVIEFLLCQSNEYSRKIAQEYVNDAFKAAIGGGNIELMNFLRGDDSAGNPVAPGLGLTKLDYLTFHRAIIVNRNWESIKYLGVLKRSDSRFAQFELVDQDNTALCLACEAGNYELVEHLLCKTDDGKFVFPLTNPVAQNNRPLVDACSGGNSRIVERLLERDIGGNYVYKGINPSVQNYQGFAKACDRSHLDVLRFLLKMEDGKYVLPEMEGINLGRALRRAIRHDLRRIVRFLLKMDSKGYVLSRMSGVDLTLALSTAIKHNRMKIIRFLLKMKHQKYVLPEVNDVVLRQALSAAIKRNHIKAVRFFLRMNKVEGEYVVPGIKVTEDMLTIAGQRPKMRELLEMHLAQQRLGQQRIDA